MQAQFRLLQAAERRRPRITHEPGPVDLARAEKAATEMLAALEEVAWPEVRQRVRFVRDETIANIVANWPKGATAARAARLGLRPDKSFADIIRQYIADCRAGPDAAQSLKGLAKERS